MSRWLAVAILPLIVGCTQGTFESQLTASWRPIAMAFHEFGKWTESPIKEFLDMERSQ